MENNFELDADQMAHQDAVKELRSKAKFFAICFGVFFVIIKIVSKDLTFFDVTKIALALSAAMYLPSKIGYKVTGSIFSGMICGLVLVIVLALFIGDREILFSLVLMGGMAADFGVSIAKVRKYKKLLTTEVIN